MFHDHQHGCSLGATESDLPGGRMQAHDHQSSSPDELCRHANNPSPHRPTRASGEKDGYPFYDFPGDLLGVHFTTALLVLVRL